MSRITKIEKYAALWLNSQGWEIEQISQELTLTHNQIKNIVKKPKTENVASNSDSNKHKLPNSKNLMITESQAGTHKVSIMTKAASEINDENRKQILAQKHKDSSNYIYKPNG